MFREHLQKALPFEVRDEIISQTGIVESLVIRMVTDAPAAELAHDPLLVWTNGYRELPVDRQAFIGPIPGIPELRPVEDMRAEEMRKLYTYNTFHAAVGLPGCAPGIGKVVDCLADPFVRTNAVSTLSEASAALQAACGFSADAMVQWNNGVLAQTNNPLLGDTIERYGADPCRKLARTDRLVGPLLLARQHNLPYEHLARAVAAGLLYSNPSDAGSDEIRAMVDSQGLHTAIL